MCIVDFHLVNPIVIAQVSLQPIDAKAVAATALGYENSSAAFDHIRCIEEGFSLSKNRSHGLAFLWCYKTLFVGFITQLGSRSGHPSGTLFEVFLAQILLGVISATPRSPAHRRLYDLISYD